jgi:hypothetical protein
LFALYIGSITVSAIKSISIDAINRILVRIYGDIQWFYQDLRCGGAISLQFGGKPSKPETGQERTFD